MAKQQQ